MRNLVAAMLLVLLIAGFALAEGTEPRAAGGPAPFALKGASGASAVNTGEKTAPPEVVDSGYVLGPGDLLGISVWKDEALTKDIVVLPDGIISFPLVGLIKAAGKTLAELKAELEEKISHYVPEPVLNVEVRQVNSMIIYVIGRVNSPGRFVINTNVDTLQALAMAGGLNPFAKRDKIRVFRTENGRTSMFPFHYGDVADGRRLEENIPLKRGDVIVVP
ncbi:MAG: Polysialic acid transport protein KpsD precursor [Syntrophorhabdaceae bacterium PtaU1.Bin034]|nr:MAG: Polysialic acid transport protein KpsD precursor [Syntrophorhabdaceae bacterium PtaU1.Bin034]